MFIKVPSQQSTVNYRNNTTLNEKDNKQDTRKTGTYKTNYRKFKSLIIIPYRIKLMIK